MLSQKRRAFSLVELLVVISIIALLIAILLPALTKFRVSANTAICNANLAGLFQGQSGYLVDNDNVFPPADRWVWSESRLPDGSTNTNQGNPTNLAGVVNGLIYEYYTVQTSYVCPVAAEVLPRQDNWTGNKLVRSYVMNWNLGPYGFDRQSQSDEETLESIKDPAGMIVNAEENTFAIRSWNTFNSRGMNDGYFIAAPYDVLGSFHETGTDLELSSSPPFYDQDSEQASGITYAVMADGHVRDVNYKGRTEARYGGRTKTWSEMFCRDSIATEW